MNCKNCGHEIELLNITINDKQITKYVHKNTMHTIKCMENNCDCIYAEQNDEVLKK